LSKEILTGREATLWSLCGYIYEFSAIDSACQGCGDLPAGEQLVDTIGIEEAISDEPK